MVEDCKRRITKYLRHRQQRENKVVRVLTHGTLEDNASSQRPPSRFWSPLDVVKVIYKDVPESLHIPASHGITQLLLKLEADGRVVYDKRASGWSHKSQRPAACVVMPYVSSFDDSAVEPPATLVLLPTDALCLG